MINYNQLWRYPSASLLIILKLNEPTKIASHRSMKNGNFCVDLQNGLIRNQFVQLYQNTAYWKRSININHPFNYQTEKFKNIAYLMEVTPQTEANFYLDFDSLQLIDNEQKRFLTIDELLDKAWEWVNLYIDPQSKDRIKMIVYKSEKFSKKANIWKNRLHIYWPNFVINNIPNRQRLAKDFQRFCNLKKLDLSVYSTGLRLPGFLKRDQCEFYSWYQSKYNPYQPEVEDIIISPSLTEKPLNFNTFNLVQALTNPLNFPMVKTKKKNNTNIITKPVAWNGEVNEEVLKSIEQYTQNKPPYQVKKKAKLPNTWFVDYKRGPDSLCVHGQQHDSWKFTLNQNNQRIRIMCMKPECRSKGWVDIHSTVASTPVPNTDLPLSTDNILNEEQEIDDEPIKDCLSFNLLMHYAETNNLDDALTHMNDYMGLLSKPLAFAHRIEGEPEWELAKQCELASRFVDIDFMIPEPNTEPGKKIKYKKKNIFNIWMRWRYVRRFSKIVFDPQLPPTQKWIRKELRSVRDQHSEILNLWKGYLVKPSNIQDPSVLSALIYPLLDHLLRIWCKNDPDIYDWFIKIFAWIIQQPWKKTNVGIILQSEQGAGKNIVFDCFKKIFGSHMISVANMDAMLNSFNDHISNGVMLILDEVIYNNSSLQAQNLKRLITEETLEVRPKYHSTYYVKSCLNCFILSNHTKVLKTEPGCRRYGIFHISSESKKLTTGYWKGKEKVSSIYDQISNIDPSHILQYFLEVDISMFDPTDIPITKERVFHMLENLQQDEAWFLFLSKEEPQWFNNQQIDSDKVWSSFKSFLTLSGTQFTKPNFTKEVFFSEIQKKFSINSKRKKIKSSDGSTYRKCVTTFPLLDVAKSSFARFMNVGDVSNVYDLES